MRTTTRIRRYSELVQIKNFEDRFEYLKLDGSVGRETFGSERYLNQKFYTSYEWRRIREHVIARDLGNDLGVEGLPIFSKLLIHHMNPITPEEIVHGDQNILDPEFLITTKLSTHNDIHYGRLTLANRPYTPRTPGDTKLW